MLVFDGLGLWSEVDNKQVKSWTSTGKDQITKLCCPCQWQKFWEVLRAISLPPHESGFFYCFCFLPDCLAITASWEKALRAGIDQNWVSCWWAGFLIPLLPHFPLSSWCPSFKLPSPQPCGLCRLTDRWILWVVGSPAELWPPGGQLIWLCHFPVV